jgi:type IV pilus assembly protein PilE
MNRVRGFTLMELMVTLAIVGILAAIAMPAYSRYVAKGNRAAAQALLMEIAQKEQQILSDLRAYRAAASCAEVTSKIKVTVDDRVTKNYTCEVTTEAGPPRKFIARMKPLAGSKQADAGEKELTIDESGKRTPADQW